MLIAMGSWRGSPGVTTTALALAECWPDSGRAVVVECDPRGGSVASRFLMAGARTIEGLASDARHGGNTTLLAEHARTTPAGVQVVTAPEDGGRLRPLLGTLAKPGGLFAAVAADPAVAVFADCGRLDPRDGEVRSVLGHAQWLLLIMRPVVEQAIATKASLGQIRDLHHNVGLVLLGSASTPAEVSAMLKLPVLGTLPLLPTDSSALVTALSGRRRVTTRFRRHATDIAHSIIEAQVEPRAAQNTLTTSGTATVAVTEAGRPL
jgi:hypothetical protein